MGSAHDGLPVWWWQRLSAVALALLAIPQLGLAWQLLHAAAPALVLEYWMGQLGTALATWFFLLAATVHGYIGVRIVVEDYVPSPVLRIPIQGALLLFSAGFFLFGCFLLIG
ncbi:MAG: succinate dehydrogenase, hydrophobic membrane anchor protein [Proteobacteria bacterium CG1_02_64_396]|nr:MAG: succinate dehydrogenase, hydrophobic membrane anchor protein [Proteobacteria bacterium CG1_02_64_396]